ncbi:MAG: ABC transporter substrate-binding protein [Chloroflexia bacterium]|nr:ABC transporter substrate-binding protein [Chloroflexia bacterium]
MVNAGSTRFFGNERAAQRITRRDLAKRAGVLGLALPALATLDHATATAVLAQEDILAQVAETGMLVALEPEAKRGGILRTAFGITTTSYDIYQGGNIAVLTHMYDGLIRFNPLDGLQSIIPSLATSWEISDDGLTYTFALREGVTFHDGEPFTADDVVATFSRAIAPPEGIISVMQSFYRSVESVEAVDAATVQFNLSEPQADLLTVLAAPFSVVYSKAALDANDQDLRGVIGPGTGPFVYEDYNEAERWVFSRNPDYWNPELPYLDGLELLHVAAWSDRGTAVLTDQAGFSWNVSVETFAEGEQRDNIGAKQVPSIGVYTVYFNTAREPFNDPRVRRAMHLALNRQALIAAFRTQESIALTRWVSHASEFALPSEEVALLPGYRPEKDEDIAAAQALMAEAGFADGISGVELLAASVAPHAEILAPAIQDLLRTSLNIDAQIRVTERALLFEEESSGNFDLVLDTPTISVSDFSAIGNLYFRTDASQNFGGYSNPEFDELLHAADLELDPARRTEIFRQIEDVLDADPPWLLMGWTFHLPMWQSYFKGHNMEARTQSVWGRLDTGWLDL